MANEQRDDDRSGFGMRNENNMHTERERGLNGKGNDYGAKGKSNIFSYPFSINLYLLLLPCAFLAFGKSQSKKNHFE